jgi:Isochorismatase family
VITKRHWGAFYGTELDLQLRRRGVAKIVLGGIATNFGVESTARAAYELGYGQVFVEDAMTSLSEETHWFSIRQDFAADRAGSINPGSAGRLHRVRWMKLSYRSALLPITAVLFAFGLQAAHMPAAWLFGPLVASALFAVRDWQAVE